MSWADGFLVERDPAAWSAPDGFPAALTPSVAFFQRHGDRVVPHGLEIVLASCSRRPSAQQMRDGWGRRRAGRASPVLLCVGYPLDEPTTRLQSGGTAVRLAVCGPVGDNPPVVWDLDVEQVERMSDCTLDEPDQHAAIRLLRKALVGYEAPVHMQLAAGLRNVGMLATQELRAGLPRRPDWDDAGMAGRPLLKLRGRRLAEGLGFRLEQQANHVHLLKVNGHSRAAAVFCSDDEPFDAPARRLDGITPASLALAHADAHGADWVLLTRGSEIRLYAARPDTGVGRKGRAETYVEANLALLAERDAGYVHLLFSAEALDTDGKIESILEASDRFAAHLAERLRDRVYDETVPALAAAVAKRIGAEAGASRSAEPSSDGLTAPALGDLRAAYEQVMVILFRLLFVACAEAKELVPYSTNARYADHSLTRLVARLAEDRRAGSAVYDETAASMWTDVKQLWSAIDTGNVAWGLPAQNGGLFSRDADISPAGAAIEAMAPLTDAELAPALSSMLIDRSPEGEGPVDFRSLSVRTFGTIYEGLLESQLSLAPQDLAVRVVKGELTYVPAESDEEVEVVAGSVYFHNRSGVRKSTGSYFTKPFAVEHLLDHALEPALDDHLARLDALAAADDAASVEATFFDFRCADIAMGSGHFLVAAVDRIEAKLTDWLARNPATAGGVLALLDRLRSTASEALGSLGGDAEIETGSLLRRQVARYCIYGADVNRVAVELARLSIWVHTFVPGLPLSFLDHNLIEGNSLTGVGTLDEVLRAFDPDLDPAAPSLFRGQLIEMLDQASEALTRLARTADATKAEIDQARQAHREALAAVAPARAIFDVVAAHRADACSLPENFDPAALERSASTEAVRRAVADLNPVHFPARFPEVFLREGRSGFDCLLGNPPWEKVVADREVWWGMHLPGVRSLPVARRRARIDALERSRPDLAAQFNADKEVAESLKHILRATFPRLGSGQTDLFKAFSWANLELARQGGRIGIVLPRTAVSDKGMEKWRLQVTDTTALSLSLSLSLSEQPAESADVGAHAHQSQGMGVRRGAQQLHSGSARDHAVISVATCLNSAQWAFDDVDGRYTVALVAACKPSPRAEPRGWL